MELAILGVWLERDSNYVNRLIERCQDVQHEAYQMLCSFYNSVPNDRRWDLLMKGLVEIDQRVKIKELGLDELHKNAQESQS